MLIVSWLSQRHCGWNRVNEHGTCSWVEMGAESNLDFFLPITTMTIFGLWVFLSPSLFRLRLGLTNSVYR